MPAARYSAALALTLRSTAAAYGYTLTIATTLAETSTRHGKPGTGDLFLFAAGGLLAFVALEGFLVLLPAAAGDPPESAFPLAGALNVLAVGAALGAAVGVAGALAAPLVWLATPLAATAAYLAMVGLQVTLVARLRG